MLFSGSPTVNASMQGNRMSLSVVKLMRRGSIMWKSPKTKSTSKKTGQGTGKFPTPTDPEAKGFSVGTPWLRSQLQEQSVTGTL